MNMKELRELHNSTNGNVGFLFFYGHYGYGIGNHVLSQWFDKKFTVDNIEYRTAEQYMMAEKARLFNDQQILSAIMAATTPKEAKQLGRKIRNFNPKVWDTHKKAIVTKGNYAKFSQNPDLKKYLLQTGDKILVESSPYDNIWGIGLDSTEARAIHPSNWPGQNLLGFCLMEVRDSLVSAAGDLKRSGT